MICFFIGKYKMSRTRKPKIVKEDGTVLADFTNMASTYEGFYRLLETQRDKAVMERVLSSDPNIWIVHTEDTQWIFKLLQPLLSNWSLKQRRTFLYPERYNHRSWLIFRGSILKCYIAQPKIETLRDHLLEIHFD